MTTCNPADLERRCEKTLQDEKRQFCKDSSIPENAGAALFAVNMYVFFFIPCNSPGTEEMSLIERGVP